MRQVLGSLCVLAAGAAGWYLRRQERRQARTTLWAVVSALEEMERHIRISRTPLPQLLELLGRRGGQAGAFFARIAVALRSGCAPQAVWAQETERLPLEPQERQALSELLSALLGDEEAACRGLRLCHERLAASLARRSRCQAQEEKRAAAVWFCAAALLVILWI